jgi:hypothetical protein
MNKLSVAGRVFLCIATVSFAVLVVALLALTISEDQVEQKQRRFDRKFVSTSELPDAGKGDTRALAAPIYVEQLA